MRDPVTQFQLGTQLSILIMVRINGHRGPQSTLWSAEVARGHGVVRQSGANDGDGRQCSK